MRLPDGHVGGQGGWKPPCPPTPEKGGAPLGSSPLRPGPVMTSSAGLGAPDTKGIQSGSLAGPNTWESKDEKERQVMSLSPGLEPRPPTSQTTRGSIHTQGTPHLITACLTPGEPVWVFPKPPAADHCS